MHCYDHRQAETPSKPAPHLRQVASLKTPCNGHAGLLTDKRWRRRATAVGSAVVRVLPMTFRNSATLRVRQSSGCVAFNLEVGTLRTRTPESYANAGVRPVAITTPEHSCVGYHHGGRHLLSLRFHPLLLPSLSLRDTIAAQVGRPFHTDTRASCVSVGYRHGSPHLLRLAEAMCYSMPPIHEGDTHHSLKPSTLMYLRSRYAIVPDAQRWL